MKGKIAFVLGVAVGYVLGTRAGRERYEQIKSGAQSLWNTEPVQRGVHLVRDAVDERLDEVKDFAKRVGADVVSSVARQATGGGSGSSTKSRAAESDFADDASEAKKTQQPARARKPETRKAAPKKPANAGESASEGDESGEAKQ